MFKSCIAKRNKKQQDARTMQDFRETQAARTIQNFARVCEADWKYHPTKKQRKAEYERKRKMADQKIEFAEFKLDVVFFIAGGNRELKRHKELERLRKAQKNLPICCENEEDLQRLIEETERITKAAEEIKMYAERTVKEFQKRQEELKARWRADMLMTNNSLVEAKGILATAGKIINEGLGLGDADIEARLRRLMEKATEITTLYNKGGPFITREEDLQDSGRLKEDAGRLKEDAGRLKEDAERLKQQIILTRSPLARALKQTVFKSTDLPLQSPTPETMKKNHRFQDYQL